MSVEDLYQFKNYLRYSFFLLLEGIFAVRSSNSVLVVEVFFGIVDAANVGGINSEGRNRRGVAVLILLED